MSAAIEPMPPHAKATRMALFFYNARVAPGGLGMKRPPCLVVVVPLAGLEPALLAEPHFECGASTNFTTGAHENDGA